MGYGGIALARRANLVQYWRVQAAEARPRSLMEREYVNR